MAVTNYEMKTSTASHPSGGGTQERHAPDSPQPQPKAPSPRAGEQLVVRTSNYSITPGPVWLEAVNPAAITVASGTPLRLDLPLQGSSFLWRYLDRPIVCVVLPPQGPPFDQDARFGSESHEPKPPDYHWWPKYAHKPIASATAADLDPNLPQEQLKRMQDALKQKEEDEKKRQAAQAKQQEKQEKQEKAEEASAEIEPFATPPPGRVDEWLQRTGMSAEGFPGFPRSLPNVWAANAGGLPATAGINRVALDDSTEPPELVVHMVGSGSILAGRRWLFFTLQGV